MSRKQTDGVEALLRRADRTLDEWFRQSRMTTQQASIVFGRFLDRATREGAGALRHQVDGLEAGLKKLSAGLQQIEHPRKPVARRRRPAAARKATGARKVKKAA